MIEPLRYRGNEVVLFHILDPNELAPKFRDPVLLQDVEDDTAMEVSPDYARNEYRRKSTSTCACCRKRRARAGLDYVFMNTAKPLDEALRNFLAHPPEEDVVGFSRALVPRRMRRAGLPVYVHLLRQYKQKPIPFSSLMFFERRTQSSIKHRRLKYLLLFALRCLFVALLVLAFARPYIHSTTIARASGGRTMVFAVDNSFSMRQGDRFAKAKKAALDQINAMHEDDTRKAPNTRNGRSSPASACSPAAISAATTRSTRTLRANTRSGGRRRA